MTRPPDFDELVDGDESPEELARLRRVHELLVEAGPPPELSPSLAALPEIPAEDERFYGWLPRRRLRAALVLVGAVVAAAFATGYLAGDRGGSDSSPGGFDVSRVVGLSGTGDATAVVSVGARGDDGNWPMLMTVQGLEQLEGGDYYILALTKKGKPLVTCGTFNVSGPDKATTVRMTAAYDLKGYDGWVVQHYDAETHDETLLLRTGKI